MTIIQPQSPETNLVGTIVNENVETDSLIIYASFRDKKTGDPRTPDPKTKLFVMDKDDSKFEIILADSHTTTDGVTTIVVNTTGRGVNKYGNLSGSGIGFRHTIGKEIGVADIHTYVEIINDIIRGTNATGSNIFRVGKEDNGDVTLYFQKDDEAIPFIRYDVSENKLVYSNNGVDTLDVGGGTGTITGGEGIGIEAGVVNVEGGVQVDDEDSAGYLEDKVTGENGIEIETVGSTDKDINIKLNDTLKANLDTLTDGSVADSLHTHSALGVITATAGEDIDGSTTPKACFIGGGDVDTTVSVEIDQTSQNSNFNLNATTNRISQSVYFQKIGTFTELKIRAGKFGSPSNLICDLYLADSNDKPTGSSLANATGSESAGVVTFTFSYSVTNQLQKYVLVIKGGATANASNYYSVMYQDSDVYTKGLARTSTDSGTTYGDSVGDIYFEITGYLGLQAGLVYLCHSTNYGTVLFDGFVTGNYLFGEVVHLKTAGQVDGFTGLTRGVFYKISTNGAITTTTAGNFISVAISTTSVIIKQTTQVSQFTISIPTKATPVTVAHNLGKKPRYITYCYGVVNYKPNAGWSDGLTSHCSNNSSNFFAFTDSNSYIIPTPTINLKTVTMQVDSAFTFSGEALTVNCF